MAKNRLSGRSRSSPRGNSKGITKDAEKDKADEGSSNSKPYFAKLSLSSTKMISQLALSCINIICWYVPLSQAHEDISQNKTSLSLASCFSGGIFLCLALTHFLPHAVVELEDAKSDKALAYLASLVGYLLVLFIDKVAFSDTQALMHGTNDASGGQSSAIVLLVAMGVHSLLETMALGMAKDSTSALMMAASIGLHQPAETLALLVAFLKVQMERKRVAQFMMLFSVIGPVGTSLGMYLKGIASAKTDALILALTSGTFIYMGATEMVIEEFSNGSRQEKVYRFAAIVAGALTILMLTQQSDKLEAKAKEI